MNAAEPPFSKASDGGPNALVVGASGGVGLALATQLASRGYRVLGLGRRPFDEIDACTLDIDDYCQCDLGDPVEATSAIEAFLDRRGVAQLGLFIYVAGVGYYGAFESQEGDSIRTMAGVNVETPVALTRALGARLGRCPLVFVSSIAAFAPAPAYAVYGATKAFLTTFAKNLAIEESGRRPVQCVHLGPVRTAFHQRSGVPSEQFDDRGWDSAESAAAKILHGIETRNRDVFTGFSGRLLKTLGSRFPEALPTLKGDGKGRGTPHHVAVTGAANGIGRALIEAFAAACPDAELSVIDRDVTGGEACRDRLGADGRQARFFATDLAEPAAVGALAAELAELRPIDVLVLNAGINRATPFFGGSAASDLAMARVNFLSPILFVHALLAADRLAPGGTLVFMASLSTFVAYPGAAVYGGTKDGLHAFANSLRSILKPRQIRVLIVYPGPTETDQARSNSPGDPARNKRMPPAVLAAKILRAAQCHHRWLVPGTGNILIGFAGRLFPGTMQRMMRKLLYEKMPPSSPGD